MVSNYKKNLSSIEEIIEEAKKGNIFILVDDEKRENEGDLVIPAEKCDDKKVNFMAKYGRGLICLALAAERVDKLALPLMSHNNLSKHKTAFTVSIEARNGITTGISAADRAQTIKVAIDCNKGAQDIISPGHIFPLKAKKGGVLVRAGHTEAAVDISILAGLNPSGVICEIMNEDGSMARMPELVRFAKKHNIKIATIADLIEYRRKNENFIKKTGQEIINYANKYKLDLITYQDVINEQIHYVIKKGDIGKSSEENPVIVRVHMLSPERDFMNLLLKKNNLINKSLDKILRSESGILLLINEENNLEGKVEYISNESGNKKQEDGLRNYGIGAQILADLGIKYMSLLTSKPRNIVGLEGFGIKICKYIKIK